ncbi:MAG: RnfH family protein [Arsenophonus endosymbiont of Ceratovacuna japonica]
MNVEVVFALPDKQFLFNIQLTYGDNIEKAIIKSGILLICNEINLRKNKVGIYSKIAKLSDILSDGDRVEIYRPLLSDPKEIRRKKVKKQKNK